MTASPIDKQDKANDNTSKEEITPTRKSNSSTSVDHENLIIEEVEVTKYLSDKTAPKQRSNLILEEVEVTDYVEWI